MKSYQRSPKKRYSKTQKLKTRAKSPKITRSTGIVVAGWAGSAPGGGFSGSTKELDDTVQKEAKLLSRLFGSDIEIRFNSDRESGGAWLKDNANNTQVGLTAGIVTNWPNGQKGYEYLKKHRLDPLEESDKPKIEALEKKFGTKVSVETLVDVDVLKDGVAEKYPETKKMVGYERRSIADWGSDTLKVDQKTVPDGVAWLRKNVDPNKIKS